MKRGLKAEVPAVAVSTSYNRYPDEKGTESLDAFQEVLNEYVVTTVTPMKRGLKVLNQQVASGAATMLQPLPR